MGVIQSRNTDILVLTPRASYACGDPEFDPNLPRELQGLVSHDEWQTTVRTMNTASAGIMCQARTAVFAFPAVFLLAVILTAAVTPYAGLLFLFVPIIFITIIRLNISSQKTVTRTIDDLNAQIYQGALLYPEYSRRRRHKHEPLFQIRINLPRLREVRSSLPSAFNTAPPATNPNQFAVAGAVAPVYVQAPTTSYGTTAAVSPMYAQPATPQPAMAAPYGGYAVAEAVPVSAVQQPTVIQLVVPQGAVPGSVLNATLSDGRVIAVTLPENVKAGQTIQVQVPLV